MSTRDWLKKSQELKKCISIGCDHTIMDFSLYNVAKPWIAAAATYTRLDHAIL